MCQRGTEDRYEAGYTEFDPEAEYYPGRRAYYNNRGKALILVNYGEKPLTEGVRFNIAHLDSRGWI